MRKELLVVFALLVTACRQPPPVPVEKLQPIVHAVPLPQPVTPVAVAAPVTPTQVEAPSPVVDLLLAALAAEDTPTLAGLLAADVTVTLSNGDMCTGAQSCALAATQVLTATKLQILRRVHPSPTVDVVQGLAQVADRRVPFVAVLVTLHDRVAQVRLYGNSMPWRYLLDPPKTPLGPPTAEPVDDVRVPAAFDVPRFVAAFDPAVLAKDATAAGLVAEDLLYHDTTAGTETTTAVANQAAIRAFAQAFDVQDTQLLGQHAAGQWLVLERDVTLRQRAPVVPVPPSDELLHLRTLEFLLIQQGKIAVVWGYADPVSFLPAVEQPPIPALH